MRCIDISILTRKRGDANRLEINLIFDRTKAICIALSQPKREERSKLPQHENINNFNSAVNSGKKI